MAEVKNRSTGLDKERDQKDRQYQVVWKNYQSSAPAQQPAARMIENVVYEETEREQDKRLMILRSKYLPQTPIAKAEIQSLAGCIPQCWNRPMPPSVALPAAIRAGVTTRWGSIAVSDAECGAPSNHAQHTQWHQRRRAHCIGLILRRWQGCCRRRVLACGTSSQVTGSAQGITTAKTVIAVSSGQQGPLSWSVNCRRFPAMFEAP
ncbi:hypothetical protein BX600DRAFT_432503 [Xylariales sp. PMI_506]|nr:hypothetical protein BX600DRAFT_432503 [Xylariales sp. PMI_506]